VQPGTVDSVSQTSVDVAAFGLCARPESGINSASCTQPEELRVAVPTYRLRDWVVCLFGPLTGFFSLFFSFFF